MRNYKLYLTNDIIVNKVIKFFFNYPNLISIGSLIILGQILSFSLFKTTLSCNCEGEEVLNPFFYITLGGITSFLIFLIYILIFSNIKIIEDIKDDFLKDDLFYYYNKDDTEEGRPLYTWDAKSFFGTYCQFCIFLQDNPQYEAFR